MKLPYFRLLASVFIVAANLAFTFAYNAVQGPIEGKASVAALQDDDVVYAASRKVIGKFIPGLVSSVSLGTLTLLWGTWIFTNRKSIFKRN